MINSSEIFVINEVKQFIHLCGTDDTNPVLLMIHGGPGFSDLPFAFHGYNSILEEHFVVVNWDQRGTGRSFSDKIPENSMTIEQFILDGIEVARLLCNRFNKDKIFMRGHSFGGLLGMLIANRYPDLFHSYFALDPAVSIQKSIPAAYNFVCEQAKRVNNNDALIELKDIGAPPFKDMMKGMQVMNQWLNVFGGVVFGGLDSVNKLFSLFGFVPDFTEQDYKNAAKGAEFSARTMTEAMNIDLFNTVPELQIPVYFGVGRHDYLNCCSVTEEYCTFIKAPDKDLIWFEYSAHFPNFSEPETCQNAIVKKMLG